MPDTTTDPAARPAANPAPAPEQTNSAPVPVPETKTEPVPQVKPVPPRFAAQRKELQKFLSSLNHLGMGRQRMMFIQSMAMMLTAGLSLVDALRTQSLEAKSKAVKGLIQGIISAVESGSPLWKAMDDQSLFSPYEIALVRIGEEGGNLARNMEYLAEQQEKDRALKAKVKMAMIYPSIVLVLVFVLIMGLGLFVLPNLVQVLYSLHVELPLATRIVIGLSQFFEAHGAVFAPLLGAGLVLMLLLGKYTRFRVVSQWIVFHTPGIGSLAREATIAQFGVILGGLLRAGVPLVEALSSLVEVTHIVSYKNFYRQMLEHVNAGDSFSKSFAALPESNRLLPVSVQQLIVTGERSGALADVLMKIADMYDKKASETAEKLPVILEPLLLIIIACIVGGIAFAIIVPIYKVVGNIGR
ncbi:MAG: type II secretion system F family protein [Candidatus Peribacteraceae bacterium]|nr:type II secretion system F family protein [Candidatus Peribacteraceae bacterium]MDD5741823.1 type II secretion system F family protein [Candidatus Peribacteraceae bacterium]